MNQRSLFLYFSFFAALGFFFAFPTHAQTLGIDSPSAPTIRTATSTQDGTYERAIVRELKAGSQDIPGGQQQQQQIVIEYLSGPMKGQTRALSSDLDSNPYGLHPNVGDRVVIFLQPNPADGEQIGFLDGFDRRVPMIWLIIIFALTMVMLAGWQGVKVVASIALSILLIGWVLIPSFLHGVNPVPIAIVLATILAGISSVFAMGWNKKSFVTIVGTMGGVLVAYLISHIWSSWSHMQGLASEEDRMFFGNNPTLDPRGLMFAGVIIAAMGVVEDVAVSIASGVVEVKHANPQASLKDLFRSGMVIGRDHMSALANTLIFAYVGGSLSTLLLYTQYGSSWLKFVNFDVVADEVVRSLSGTIGLVFTVPITAILAALAFARVTSSSPTDTASRTSRIHVHTPPTNL